ncbi:MAG TPA: class I SAM-dependent methyltransferase [Bryobacterales bacterium]|nr:class I SAM-dependent methyltransferase [Bryobacterales bacterium]
MNPAGGNSHILSVEVTDMPAAGGRPPAGFPLCPHCGGSGFAVLFSGSDRLYHTTARRFEIVECARCSLLRLEPQPTAAELHEFYPENYWWAPDPSVTGRLEGVYRNLVLGDHLRFVAAGLEEQHLEEPRPVLDAGCGGGSFLAALARHGFRVAGLDFSARAASVAWRANGVAAVCASLDHAPFPPETFRAITLFHVLEHLPRPGDYLDAAHRLLVPGGRLYVQVPNAACWQFLLLGARWSGIDIPRHLIHFRAADLERLLAAHGFRVLRRKFFSLRDNPAGLATSLAPELEPMSRRVRRVVESPAARLAKNLLYLALAALALPLTALEAAAGSGSTILIEAARQ